MRNQHCAADHQTMVFKEYSEHCPPGRLMHNQRHRPVVMAAYCYTKIIRNASRYQLGETGYWSGKTIEHRIAFIAKGKESWYLSMVTTFELKGDISLSTGRRGD